MDIDKLSAGKNPPAEIVAIIEIPAHSEPVKYEVDKDTNSIFVDRFINAPVHYPANYGFIPKTLSEDGDPVDVLVITPTPLLTGSVIHCRPLDALDMKDESGRDLKLIAAPLKGMNSGYDDVESIDDLPANLTAQIVYFFEYYKKLEPEKWVEVVGWTGKDKACAEIRNCIARYSGQ